MVTCVNNQRGSKPGHSYPGTDLQVDDGSKLAEMLVEFADVVKLGGNLPNKQLGVGRELSPFVAALVVGFVKVDSEQRGEN